MPKVSIIIVSYNTKNILSKCLDKIYKYLADNVEIILIDNASTDDTVKLVKSKYPKVKMIENSTNKGFSKAVNQGIKISSASYVLLLNSDIELIDNSLEQMIDFMKIHPEIGIMGGKLLNIDKSPQSSVYRLPSVSGAIREYWLGQRGSFEKYLPVGDTPSEVDSVVGANMLIKKEVIEKIGLLDERYFMYFEDLDYCRRAKHAGFKIFYYPNSCYIHYHGASGSKVPQKTNQWLVDSSKSYHGLINYYLITFIILLRHLFDKIFKA